MRRRQKAQPVKWFRERRLVSNDPLLKFQTPFLRHFPSATRKEFWRTIMIDLAGRPDTDFNDLDLNALLHPASAFDHPRDVLNDPDLTRAEKRAILSSWASDACAVSSAPGLRHAPGTKQPVTFDEIIDALRSLDDPPPRPGGKSMRLRPPWQRNRDRDGMGGVPA
jgi:hypothetical protein